MYSVYACDFLKVCNLISKKDRIRCYASFERSSFDLLLHIDLKS